MESGFSAGKNWTTVHKEMDNIEDQVNKMGRNLKVQTEGSQSLGLTARNSSID